MGNSTRDKRTALMESIRNLHAAGWTRDDIQSELQTTRSAVYEALRFVETDFRACTYDPEPHDVVDHRNCRGRDIHMDYDDPEENPK